MRINYEIKNNIFKICNEYSGIDQFKKTLLKKNKIVTYTKFITLQLIMIIFVSLLLYIGFYKINLSIFIDCTTKNTILQRNTYSNYYFFRLIFLINYTRSTIKSPIWTVPTFVIPSMLSPDCGIISPVR